MRRCECVSAELRPADEVRDERRGECLFMQLRHREFFCSDGNIDAIRPSREVLVRIDGELIPASLPLLSKSSGVNKWVGYPRFPRCRRLFVSLTPISLLHRRVLSSEIVFN